MFLFAGAMVFSSEVVESFEVEIRCCWSFAGPGGG